VKSALYPGLVTHARTRPRRHELAYRVYMMLFDLDELEALDRRLRLFSVGRFNLLSFYPGDHGDGGTRLREWVRGKLAAAGIEAGGAIRVLCYPRVLGMVFNPISTFFCHRADGTLAAILYEVNNTFGQRHSYLIAVADPAARPIRQSCAKALYVSPFMGMDMRYDFAVRPPGADVALTVRGSDVDGTLIVATFAGRRREVSDGAVLATFLRHPLLTAKVVGGIHWEALKLWIKGVRLTQRPV
jgi:hypothetical protein